MKKIFFLLILFLLLPNFVNALDEREVNVRTFRIIVEFNEAVDISDAEGNIINSTDLIADFPPYSNYELRATYNYGTKYLVNFDNTIAISDGIYTFDIFFKKRNSIDQTVHVYPMRINVSAGGGGAPYLFDINLFSPVSGFSNGTSPFNISFLTEVPATCKYIMDSWTSYNNMRFIDLIDHPLGTIHLLTYTPRDRERTYWIGCRSTQDTSRESYKSFLLGWTNGASEITRIVQDPEPVVDESERRTNLIITTEDKSICQATYYGSDATTKFPSDLRFAEMKLNNSYYLITNTINVCLRTGTCNGLDITDSHNINDVLLHQYTVFLTCYNRAWNVVNGTKNITIQLTNDPRLEYVRPNNYEAVGNVQLNLISKINLDRCSYTLTSIDGIKNYQRISSKNYSSTERLIEGSYTINSTCYSTYLSDPVNKIKLFKVDGKAPTFSYEIPAVVCKEKEFEVSWEGEDETSGIDAFYWSLLNGTTSIENGSFKSHKKDLEFDNPAGEYTFSAYITDGAGNAAREISKKIKLVNDTDIACDTEAPKVTILDNKTDGKTLFRLLCVDKESGCENNYKYNLWPGSSTGAANCTYNKTGEVDKDYEVTVTSILCYRVEDKADNVKEGKEKISVVIPGLEFCDNNKKDYDETDIDCGGSCQSCVVGKVCGTNSDCKSGNICSSGICTAGTLCIIDNQCPSKHFCNDLGMCELGVSCSLNSECSSGYYCNDEKICEKVEVECYVNSECSYGKECVSNLCVRIQGPTPTDPVPDPAQSEKGMNWVSLIIGIFGVLLLGGGGYFYYSTGLKPSTLSTSVNEIKKPNAEELTIKRDKKLDYKDTKKVKELRDKLSKQTPNTARKTLLGAFDTKEKLDKELPEGIEKTNIDLIPRVKQKDLDQKTKKLAEKKVIKQNAKQIGKQQKPNKKSTEELDESEEYIPLEKLKKKEKDVFDELEEI